MFIQVETTPNPATLKFLPGQVILANGAIEFSNAEQAAEQSGLAAKLFAIPGVSSVFFGYDFISVTKADAEWQHLKPAILGTIMEYLMAKLPIIHSEEKMASSHEDEEFFDEKDTEIVDTIKEILETRVRPAVANDGGDITFRGFEGGIVYLNMRGACAGCPSSTATLKHGIENLLRHFVPEVLGVEAMPQ